MTQPTDPLYSGQWHLDLIGDIARVWDLFTGQGVRVAVYDDGLETTHADLDGNIDASTPFVYGGVTYVPTPISASDGHGTAVAGLIAAEANNGLGGVGVAWGAHVAGFNFLEDIQFQSNAVLDAALRHAANFDIMSNSWGVTPLYQKYQSLAESTSVSGTAWEMLAYDYDAATGRGGLGTVIVQAAGNDRRNADGDGANASRLTITVAATGQAGEVTSYSNFGPSILIAAPAASVTTDRSGEAGYNATGTADGDPQADTDYTTVFGGTSAATPVVSGVVALMLQANPQLGWRDVHNILALSASHTGSAMGAAAAGYEVEAWQANASGTWNGGGMTRNASYGYGMVDALAAVSMAQAWLTMTGAAQTSANEATATGVSHVTVGLNDNAHTIISTQVTANVLIETVMVNVNITHSYASDLVLTLIAPDGSRFTLMKNEGADTLMDSGFNWTFGLEGARGMSSAGTWKLDVWDTAAGDVGTLRNFSLDIKGSAPLGYSIHTVTDDYRLMTAYASGRATLRSATTNDWLNFAGVTGNVTATLAAGAAFAVDGVTWGTLAGNSGFHKITTGWGNDVITATQSGAEVWLGVGDDTVIAGPGNGIYQGGAGTDTLDFRNSAAGVAVDLFNRTASGGSAQGATFAGFEILIGSASGNDTLSGSWGADTLSGLGGNDVIADRGGNDIVDLGAGNDQINVGGGADSYAGGTGTDMINYFLSPGGVMVDLGQNMVSGSWAGDDTISGFESVQGSNVGNDTLTGSAGDNILLGMGGNDTLSDLGGNDSLNGGAGDDLVIVGSGNDKYYGEAGIDTITYAGATGGVYVHLGTGYTYGNIADGDTIYGFENLIGSDVGNDTLQGSAGANILYAGAGNDNVFDLAGDDFVYLGDGNDQIMAGDGRDYMDGGNGADTLNYVGSVGGVTVDLLAQTASGGWAEGDVIVNFEHANGSSTGDDHLYGNNLTNVMMGYGGNDVLDGRAGVDYLTGGGGNDTITGGVGRDTFSYNPGCGNDQITDFLSGTDTLRILGFGFASVADVVALCSQQGADVFVALGTYDTILLANCAVDTLGSSIVLT